MIDRETVDRIKEAANIVDVVSEFVTLRKSGANYKGLCPFHNERTPSFMVSPARGTCHCFGCGKGGNPISFIMEHEQMDYPEALRWLANKYGIEIKERELSDEERREQNERESMFIVNEWAASYFENLLRNNPDGVAIGMQYYRSRGFRDDVIKKFRLGYDLRDSRALARQAKTEGYNEDFLVKTGICYRTDRGDLIDRYSERVVFPWINLSGKVVGFSARVLDSRTKGVNQKYVNSPDSEIYHKDHELFGIYQAKKSIAKEDRVFIVEGQTDVISMHQCGIENVVANSGTALSIHQIHMLHRFTSNITLLYDGDAAGIHAAMRGTDMLLSEDMNIKVLFLPDGDDPDSFARKHTVDDFRQYVDEHQTDFMTFKANQLVNGVTDPQKRSEGIESIINSISLIPNQILRDTYLHDCSVQMGIAEKTLINRMNLLITERRSNKTPQSANNATAATPQSSSPASNTMNTMAAPPTVERLIAQHIVRHGDAIILNNVEDDEGNIISLNVAQYIYYNFAADGLQLQTPVYRTILEEAMQHSGEEGFVAETYFINHQDIEISRICSELSVDRYALTQQEKKVAMNDAERQLQEEKIQSQLRQQTEHLVLDFRRDYIEGKLKALQQRIIQGGLTPEEQTALMQEYRDMQMMRNELAKAIGLNVL